MNHFDIKAFCTERTFVNRIKNGAMFQTAIGRNNMIVDVTNTSLIIKTERSRKPLRISRRKFREAISFLYYARTTTRKELERFANYNSALMGLLKLIFADIAKVTRTVRGLLRLSLKGMRFYFSGVEGNNKDQNLIHSLGGQMVLMSYYYLRKYRSDSWKDIAKKLGMKILLDSGEYSRFKRVLRGQVIAPLEIKAYADFIEQHKDVLFHWVNLDVIGDPAQSEKNAQYLIDRGLQPMEVWHAQSSWADLEKLVRKDLPVIGVGGSAMLSNEARRQIFGELFERFPTTNFHLLGGGPPIITEYPWFSADANTWRIGRSANRIVTVKGQRQTPRDWDVTDALIYSIRKLVGLEDNYNESYQLELFPLRPC